MEHLCEEALLRRRNGLTRFEGIGDKTKRVPRNLKN